MAPALGLCGGTFDPVHFGHLRLAAEMREAFRLERVMFLPAGHPWQRSHETYATGADRVRMLQLAIAGEPAFAVDDREVRRVGPSYTVTTLSELRSEQPQCPLVLVVGKDAFLGLPTWHQWREILQLAHVAVAHRPGWRAPTSGALGELLQQRGTDQVTPSMSGTAAPPFPQPWAWHNPGVSKENSIR